MNTLIFILLAMLTSSNELEAQLPQTSIIEGDVYIYDYAMKKHNQAHIGFIVINNDLIVQDISFTVNFSKGKVKNVCRRDHVVTKILRYSKREDGNILTERNAFLCYNSENFIRGERQIPDYIYKMISSSFLKMTNKERLNVLNELSM